MKKNKHENKHANQIQKKHGLQNEKQLTPEEIADQLRQEILDEVRAVSTGAKASIYEMIEKDKELAAIEAELKEKAPQTAKPTPEQVAAEL